MTAYAIYIAAWLMSCYAAYKVGHFFGGLDGHYHGFRKGLQVAKAEQNEGTEEHAGI